MLLRTVSLGALAIAAARQLGEPVRCIAHKDMLFSEMAYLKNGASCAGDDASCNPLAKILDGFDLDAELAASGGTVRSPSGDGAFVYGYAVDLLEALSEETGIPVELYITEQASEVADGSAATAFLRYFASNLTDFDCVFSGTYVRNERLAIIDYMLPVKPFGFAVWTTAPVVKDLDMWNWKRPFSNTLWFLLALYIVFGAIVMYVLEGTKLFLAPGEELDEYRSNLGKKEPFGYGFGVSLSLASGAITGGENFAPRTAGGRLFSTVYTFTALLLVSAYDDAVSLSLCESFLPLTSAANPPRYTANLAVFLIGQSEASSIESIASFEETDTAACVCAGQVEAWVTKQYPATKLRVKDCGAEKNYVDPLVDGMQSGECAGLVSVDTTYSFHMKQEARVNGPERPCLLEGAGGKLNFEYWGVPFRKDLPNSTWHSRTRARFDEGLTALMESADRPMLALGEAWFPDDLDLNLKCPVAEDDAQLDHKDMAGIFIVGLCAIPCALLLKATQGRRKRMLNRLKEELGVTPRAADGGGAPGTFADGAGAVEVKEGGNPGGAGDGSGAQTEQLVRELLRKQDAQARQIEAMVQSLVSANVIPPTPSARFDEIWEQSAVRTPTRTQESEA